LNSVTAWAAAFWKTASLVTGNPGACSAIEPDVSIAASTLAGRRSARHRTSAWAARVGDGSVLVRYPAATVPVPATAAGIARTEPSGPRKPARPYAARPAGPRAKSANACATRAVRALTQDPRSGRNGWSASAIPSVG
jgi:hypothetical protein